MAERGTGVFVMPGNDDPWTCDAVLEDATTSSRATIASSASAPYEMISCA